MSHNSEPDHGGSRPVFSSGRPRVGGHATVLVASTIQASGTLTRVGPDGAGTVDVGGREVSGVIIPSLRRLHLTDPHTNVQETEHRDEDPSPC